MLNIGYQNKTSGECSTSPLVTYLCTFIDCFCYGCYSLRFTQSITFLDVLTLAYFMLLIWNVSDWDIILRKTFDCGYSLTMKYPSFIACVPLDFLFGCFTITIIITKQLNYKTSKYFIKLLIDVPKNNIQTS